MYKAFKAFVIMAIMSMVMLSIFSSTAQAATDGAGFKFIAKGTLYDGYGQVHNNDIWFTFSITSEDPHVLTLGNNSNDVDYTNFRSFGSAGTINSMSGPNEWIDDGWSIAILSITALYEYGVSKTTVTLRAPGGAVVMSPNPNAGPATALQADYTALIIGVMAGTALAVSVAAIYLHQRKGSG